MNEKTLAKIVGAWPGVSSDIKWQDDLVFSVVDKMFVVLCLRGKDSGRISFKVDPERFLELTDQPGILPAPYMAKHHWITLPDTDAIGRKTLDQMLRRSYELVRAKLPKKVQRELGDQ